jgi:hypothetical protein
VNKLHLWTSNGSEEGNLWRTLINWLVGDVLVIGKLCRDLDVLTKFKRYFLKLIFKSFGTPKIFTASKPSLLH